MLADDALARRYGKLPSEVRDGLAYDEMCAATAGLIADYLGWVNKPRR